jgi:hypothetical protein
MAVRDDFAPGEILTSSDLNDTFASKLTYPAGGSDGDLLAKDGTDAEWIAVPEAGLTLITAETFSAVSSVSLDGCFTSDYRNYRLLLEADNSTTATTQMRLRASGSDNSASVYDIHGVHNSGASVFGFNSQDASLWTLTVTSSLQTRWFSFDLWRPQLAAATLLNVTLGQTSGATGIGATTSGVHTEGNVFDGFSLIASTGTITGIVRVYGYKN